MRYSAILVTFAFFLSICVCDAGPMPIGTDTMPIQGGRIQPTQERAPAHSWLTKAQTLNFVHCDKDLHTTGCVKRCAQNGKITTAQSGVVHTCSNKLQDYRCVKKCVIKATKVQPSGPPPIWHVRGGTAFPMRDKEAENATLERIYSPRSHAQGIKIESQ
jgi:hypothetical protein